MLKDSQMLYEQFLLSENVTGKSYRIHMRSFQGDEILTGTIEEVEEEFITMRCNNPHNKNEVKRKFHYTQVLNIQPLN